MRRQAGQEGEAIVTAPSQQRRLTLRTVVLVICIGVLLVVNWAALDDITTGTEQSLLLEWATFFLTLGGIVVGALVGLRRRKR